MVKYVLLNNSSLYFAVGGAFYTPSVMTALLAPRCIPSAFYTGIWNMENRCSSIGKILFRGDLFEAY